MSDAALFLRELVQAVAALRPSAETIPAIGRLLGFTTDAPPVPRTPFKLPPRQPTHVEPPETEVYPQTQEPEEFLPIQVRAVRGPRHGTQPFSWTATQPFPPPTAEDSEPPPALAPLLRPLWSRAIVASALATAAQEGEIDIPRVVEVLARKVAFTEIPRIAVPTLRRGAQVLVHTGPTMVPFVRDQEYVLSVLRPVAGRERVDVLDFADVPTRGVFAKDGATLPYAPPLRRKPVVLLTDLGIGRGGEIVPLSEWLDFARIVQRAGCPLIAFVPYPPARWPKELRRRMTIIQWDRNTTVSVVRTSIARGGGGR